MAIALRGAVTSGANGGGVNSCTVNKPTGVVSGDVVYIFVTLDTNNGPTVTITGFTSLAGPTGNSAAMKSQVFRRVCDGGEGSTFTVSLTANSAVIRAVAVAYSGVDNVTPEDVATTLQQDAAGGSNTTTPTAASQTTVTANAQIVYCAMLRGGASTGQSATVLGGATEQYDAVDAGGPTWVYVEDLTKAVAGAVALSCTVVNTANFNVAQVALRPAAAGGVAPPILSKLQAVNTASGW